MNGKLIHLICLITNHKSCRQVKRVASWDYSLAACFIFCRSRTDGAFVRRSPFADDADGVGAGVRVLKQKENPKYRPKLRAGLLREGGSRVCGAIREGLGGRGTCCSMWWEGICGGGS